jgi:hypothetical protein
MAEQDSGKETEAYCNHANEWNTERELLPIEGIDIGKIAATGWHGWI